MSHANQSRWMMCQIYSSINTNVMFSFFRVQDIHTILDCSTLVGATSARFRVKSSLFFNKTMGKMSEWMDGWVRQSREIWCCLYVLSMYIFMTEQMVYPLQHHGGYKQTKNAWVELNSPQTNWDSVVFSLLLHLHLKHHPLLRDGCRLGTLPHPYGTRCVSPPNITPLKSMGVNNGMPYCSELRL